MRPFLPHHTESLYQDPPQIFQLSSKSLAFHQYIAYAGITSLIVRWSSWFHLVPTYTTKEMSILVMSTEVKDVTQLVNVKTFFWCVCVCVCVCVRVLVYEHPMTHDESQ